MISFIQIDNLTKSFGDLVLFENISYQLSKGQKVALVAVNGAGKTTLFNILCNKDSADSGSIVIPKDLNIGFLEQNPDYNEENTVLEQVLLSSGEIIEVIKEYENSLVLNDKIRMQSAMEKMDKLDAWDFEAKIKQILGKLKIEDLQVKMKFLSGGQRKRVALANSLIKEPDLLIMDEPTNQLDLDMIEWLEDFLKKSNLTIFMVTHDRYFLDRICDEILEIDNKQLYRYHGNYPYFLEKKDERLVNENMAVEKARNLLRRELDWMRRMPKARTTKSKSRIDSFYELKEFADGAYSGREMNINIHSSRLGSKIINIKNLNKSFGSRHIIKNFSYNFARFEKVGILGNNGTGKSTFLNLITGNINPDTGKIDVGDTITFGYYRQEGISFDESMKVIDAVQSIAEVVTVGTGTKLSVSQFLNYFLFSYETQNSYIYKLSGGEKRRLYLATILMKNPNFLILDEPTNDLDIQTLNVLEDYLMNFKGCVIIVSHDRYFLDKVVDHLFIFEGNGMIKPFPGNYSDYFNYKSEREKRKNLNIKSEKKTESYIQPNTKNVKKFTFKEQREYDLLTIEIEQLETEYKNLENSISNGFKNYEESVKLSERLNKLIILIDNKTNRWIELSELKGN
jgi:ABC transport system ATP-binding/permease protein